MDVDQDGFGLFGSKVDIFGKCFQGGKSFF